MPGTTMFLSMYRRGTLLLLNNRRFVDDMPARLAEYIHKRTQGKTYYNLKMALTKRFATITGINKADKYEIYNTQKGIIIEY